MQSIEAAVSHNPFNAVHLLSIFSALLTVVARFGWSTPTVLEADTTTVSEAEVPSVRSLRRRKAELLDECVLAVDFRDETAWG